MRETPELPPNPIYQHLAHSPGLCSVRMGIEDSLGYFKGKWSSHGVLANSLPPSEYAKTDEQITQLINRTL